MQRNRRTCLWTLLIGLNMTLAASADIKVGDPLPDLTSYQLEGKLPELAKDKVILLDFWASWCGPCAESFPIMEELNKKYGSQGLVIIAVNEDEKKGNMDNFLKKHNVTFSVVRDARQKLVEKAGIPTMPSSILIDRHGRVVFAHSGFHGSETKKQYEREIESLLKRD
jgi:cytochrome c biogenesis protein CcmG/thiol:disulfide interchange protein DsbE